MKTIRLLQLAIAGVVLVNAGLYAAPPHPAPGQAASESAPKAVSDESNRSSGDTDGQSDARAKDQERPSHSGNSRPRNGAVTRRPRRPQPIARQGTVPHAATPTNVRPLAPAQSAAVLNRGSLQNETIYRTFPVRPGGMVRPFAPSARNVRHRDPNAPVIGGAASSSNRNTAAIDGMRTSPRGSRN